MSIKKDKIKIGVMGLFRGIFVLQAAQLLSDDIVVTAVMENDETTLEKARKLFAYETKVYSDYDEFINSGIDAVVLCNFFHEHAKYAIKAMNAGVAVLSETTAAPSLGECVDLVEAAEATGVKYMLGANCPYFKAVHAMKEIIDKKVYGEVMYADAEYIHPPQKGTAVNGVTNVDEVDYDNLHWRQTLPTCYYNMHTLGPLMYITNSVPVKVLCKAVVSKTPRNNKATNSSKGYSITEMDNGAVFNTTGCVGYGTGSKWYRVACEWGTLESDRYGSIEKLIEVGTEADEMKLLQPSWSGSQALSKEEEKAYEEQIAGAGHGGIDLVLMIHFIKYLRDEEQPFFDVYRSVALSAAGILGWYSVLSGSAEYEIPDFHKKEERDKVRGDYRVPFAKKYSDLTLPCKLGESLK